jgi:RNA polymerase sigma factor for flagellar operon FliA
MTTGDSAARKLPAQQAAVAPKSTKASAQGMAAKKAYEAAQKLVKPESQKGKDPGIATRAKPMNDDPMRNQIIMDYAPLIKYIAQKIAARLPSNIDIDDLFSAGVIGLMDAIDKYDPSRDNKFKTYAEFRIRGAILDELRSQDWVPRSVREVNKREDRARTELEHLYGRPPSEKEIAEFMQIPLDEYQERTGRTRVSLLSIEELGVTQNGDRKSLIDCLENTSTKNPFVNLKNKAVWDAIQKTVEELPEKQKLVLSLYYYEDLNLKEIGRILDVTESRVSQLHTQAVQKMRLRLKNSLIE